MTTKQHNILAQETCEAGVITLRDDGILTFHPHDYITTCNMENLTEMYDIFMRLTKGVPHLYFSDNTNLKSFGSEERNYVSRNFHHFAIACGIKEASAIVRFITHTMIHINRPQIPLKMFKTEEESIEWLKSLKTN